MALLFRLPLAAGIKMQRGQEERSEQNPRLGIGPFNLDHSLPAAQQAQVRFIFNIH